MNKREYYVAREELTDKRVVIKEIIETAHYHLTIITNSGGFIATDECHDWERYKDCVNKFKIYEQVDVPEEILQMLTSSDRESRSLAIGLIWNLPR